MRLIDVDAEVDRVCNEVCGHDRKHCAWGKEGCNQIEELEKAETVKAIPLWWLEMLAENINLTYGGDESRELKKQVANVIFDTLIDKWKGAN